MILIFIAISLDKTFDYLLEEIGVENISASFSIATSVIEIAL